MRALIEIAEATSPISMRKLLSGSSRVPHRRSKIYRYYRYLREGDLDEETIIRRLYGKGVDASDGRFRTLKSRLKKTMLDSLLNEEVMSGSYKTYDDALITGYRKLNLARILSIRRAYKAAEEVASSTFKYVKDYEIIPLNEGLTDILSGLYLGILNNPKLFHKYHELHQYYVEALFEYSKVGHHYRLLRSKVYAHQDSPRIIGAMNLKFVEENRYVTNKYPKVPPLQAMMHVTEMIGLKLVGEYDKAIAVGNRAEKVLSSCKGVSKLVVSGMAVMQVECAVNLRNFNRGAAQIERARSLVPKGTINDIKVSEYAVLLGLQTSNYDYSYQEILNLDRETLKKLPNDQVTEIWHILEAYIRFLAAAGKIKLASTDQRLRTFRMAKFMNNVPNYAANKFGMNIQILVLQAMFFIVNDEHQKFVERTDSLARYCNRYLKDNENLRHNCFFRLLIEVVKGQFNLKSRKRQIKTIYARLTSEHALTLSRENNSEIVPYEVLWEILKEHLPGNSGLTR